LRCLEKFLTAEHSDAMSPVDYSYDEFGEKVSMTTYRNLVGSDDPTAPQGDVTRWLRDEATGLVTNKVYADGKGPRYDYTPDGKLATRIWARGIVTTYSYDDKGKTTRQRWIRRFVELEEKSRNFDFAFEDDNGRMVGASQFYDPDHSKFGESEDSSDSMIITRTQKEWSAEISTSVINGIDLEMQYDTEVWCVACSQLINFKKQTN